MTYEINKNLWQTCIICGIKISELAKKHGGCGVYYTEVFEKHLEIDHQISTLEYFINIAKLERPKCKCGICNEHVDITCRKGPFRWKEYKCGRYPNTLKWSKEAKISRKGSKNPMFGKTPWNFGLNKDNHPSIMNASLKSTGKIISEESKLKMSISAKKRKIHGHTSHKHSKENIEKFRQNTIASIKAGKFKQTDTKPHKLFKNILSELNIKFEEEYLDGYLFDFYLNDYLIYIEIDGDYFHSNPIKYPDGPKTITQQVNFIRDQKKNKYCVDNNLKLIRFWEYDIINNPKEVICKLKQLLELNI